MVGVERERGPMGERSMDKGPAAGRVKELTELAGGRRQAGLE